MSMYGRAYQSSCTLIITCRCNNAIVFLLQLPLSSELQGIYRYWYGFIVLQELGNLLRAQIVYEHCSSHDKNKMFYMARSLLRYQISAIRS